MITSSQAGERTWLAQIDYRNGDRKCQPLLLTSRNRKERAWSSGAQESRCREGPGSYKSVLCSLSYCKNQNKRCVSVYASGIWTRARRVGTSGEGGTWPGVLRPGRNG